MKANRKTTPPKPQTKIKTRVTSRSEEKRKSPLFRGIFVFLDKIKSMFFKSKKKREEESAPLPVLCSTYCVVWNTEEDVENNPSQSLYTDYVPIIFDVTKVTAIQAEVEFRNDGSAAIGSRTLIYLIGSGEPLIIDCPYKTFVESFTLLKSNEAYNNTK